ncbi:hypothetical protein GCM10010401_22710 [Rarobacter faecitabidus]|uniref:Uncharacterized protein n=1 Tax=Rarobacter faecitabidus TaxID=13243 RepID=A0A542ZVT3_RARFA|nr:hypothetical protein [Rarobacter faecitabidus]TQL64473.1 hypothetical protein FB461_0977 [Rarobacter faecitabidus]
MKRLFWVGVGVAVAVVATKKWRELKEQPGVTGTAAGFAESVAKQAGDRAAALSGALWERATHSAREFVDEFRVASAEREQELRESLLAETQGSEEDLRRRRAESARHRSAAARSTADADEDAFAGDEEHLGYEF